MNFHYFLTILLGPINSTLTSCTLFCCLFFQNSFEFSSTHSPISSYFSGSCVNSNQVVKYPPWIQELLFGYNTISSTTISFLEYCMLSLEVLEPKPIFTTSKGRNFSCLSWRQNNTGPYLIPTYTSRLEETITMRLVLVEWVVEKNFLRSPRKGLNITLNTKRATSVVFSSW